MRVFTKKSFRFVHPSGDKSVVTKALAFSDLPEWVTKDPMFGWAKSDGDIEVIQSRSDELQVEKEQSETSVDPGDDVSSENEEDEDGGEDEESDTEVDGTPHVRKLRRK